MIKEPTVFILGAGASYPYGLPLAKDLRTQINFEFELHIKKQIESREKDSWRREEMCEEVQEFTNAFFKSSDRSIDVWLVKNPDFMRIGKQAIVSIILNGEHNGGFREKAPYQGQDWYSYLWQRMTTEFTHRDDYKLFSENHIDFITFNYDRSLEYFLFESLENSFYGISSKDVIEQLIKRKIIHVYGQIAPLDWQGLGNLPYGKDPGKVWPGRFVENLKIIYEAKDTAEVKEAHKLIDKAKRIFFLGFGYSKENLEILRIPEILVGNQMIYGTALGLTEKERGDVESVFTKVSIRQFHTGLDCLGLLRQYL